jgi:tetratricopeptide (TPR) repeat protein
MARMGLALAAGAMGLALAPWGAGAQIPESFENLQVLPEDLPRDSLIEIMRGFSFALGVRCQYCHVGGNGVSFEDVVFESDDDPDKVKARRMLEMVRDLNDVVLPSLPERDSPPVEVGCKTCHRAQARPVLLEDELRAALDEFGPDSASARYRSYRENPRVLLAGAFNFSEWEVNVLAERLGREGRTSDAIAIYELNAEYYPESVSIHLSLGALHVTANDTTAAIRSYERALQLNPNSDQIRERLQTLRGG